MTSSALVAFGMASADMVAFGSGVLNTIVPGLDTVYFFERSDGQERIMRLCNINWKKKLL